MPTVVHILYVRELVAGEQCFDHLLIPLPSLFASSSTFSKENPNEVICEAAAGQSMKRRYKNLRDKETPSTHNDRKIMVVHGSGTKNKICCQEGGIAGTKKPPFGGFTTLLIALIILLFPW
ncbi:hypothetical protein ACRRAT_04665 [Enterobacter hormaechei]|uniref:hypothetical protein n=1 Tax=Enterobacter hormaechei TaxID=158836 RepID=UPI00129B7951|nr:hypothetical protein [Enterobacter hormaechei]MCO0819698.1 hypothetical protein [Enterobacter hormaechei]MDT8099149.1 hypothetical protein [Enterobacter hormaechei]MDT8250133.1 hypothetical protein [Enterobacter hormaechei]MDY7176536.1 hypothetical protein [Enterobacter hormaechei]MDY7630504.1 hypothetical protein [Enterobacter hormaechei]